VRQADGENDEPAPAEKEGSHNGQRRKMELERHSRCPTRPVRSSSCGCLVPDDAYVPRGRDGPRHGVGPENLGRDIEDGMANAAFCQHALNVLVADRDPRPAQVALDGHTEF
jgi:hypothetical protein